MKKRIKYFFKQFIFLKALNSPFKPFKLKWYIGKVAVGTPYFYPRKWVKVSREEASKTAMKRVEKLKLITTNQIIPNFDSFLREELRKSKVVPKLIGFDFVALGWKTKWTDTDYRFEYSPLISFVFFKWQIAVVFLAPEPSHYWESWLYYEFNTDKSKSQKERIVQCQKEFKQNWISWKNEVEIKTNYYNFILKNKYFIL